MHTASLAFWLRERNRLLDSETSPSRTLAHTDARRALQTCLTLTVMARAQLLSPTCTHEPRDYYYFNKDHSLFNEPTSLRFIFPRPFLSVTLTLPPLPFPFYIYNPPPWLFRSFPVPA